MATEQQPAATVLGGPKESPTLGVSSGPEPSQPVEFRGFKFFSQREHNEYKDASRAYFAEKNGNPSSWLGDATPPASTRPSLDEPRPVPGDYPHPPSDNEATDERRILGLQRPWFWTLLAIIAVVVIVAIGVGVGVGTTRAANSSKNASGVEPASDATGITIASTSTLVLSGVTAATPSSSPTAARTPTVTPQAKKGCPEINGTIYQVPGSTKKFMQLCGIDYGEEDGAVNIRNVYTDTSQECINNCAGTMGCTGCGWGFIDGDRGPPFRCWLKEKVDGKSHLADPTWYFAVLL